MSYDIVYDRQFIKSPAGITPLVLIGSNNVTECTWNGRERRAREWAPLFNVPALTAEELCSRTEACCGGPYQEHFVRGGKWVDDQGFVRFMRNGVKKARTIEEIRSLKPGTHLRCSLSVYRRSKTDDSVRNSQELIQIVCTTEDFLTWIEAARNRVGEKQENESIYYCIEFPRNEPLKLPSVSSIDQPVVARKGNAYISSISEHGVSFSRDHASALVFESIEDARSRIPAYFRRDIRLCSADSIIRKQQRRHVIQVASGSHAGAYVKRLTRYHMHMTASPELAHRFPSRESALQYINGKLRPRLKALDFEVQILPDEQEVCAQ